MVSDLRRTLRAQNWHTNKRSFPAATELAQAVIVEARRLHLAADYDGCIDLLKSQVGWEHDARAQRLIGLCCQGLAQYESDPDKKGNLFDQAEAAHMGDLNLRHTEVAKSHVNLAAAFIGRHRYGEALEAAKLALEADSSLVTAHIIFLAVHLRRADHAQLKTYVEHLAIDAPWIFAEEAFIERLENDPDLDGVSDIIATLRT